MASVRQNLIDAMVAYLQDQGNTIATYLDAPSVRGMEYVNDKYTRSEGEALVSIPDVQIPSRATSGNTDEFYTLFVSLGITQRSHVDGDTGDMQAIFTAVREALSDDFQLNRETLWGYYDNTDGKVLSTKFNKVELGVPDFVIGADNQTATISFNIIVHLTRDVS